MNISRIFSFAAAIAFLFGCESPDNDLPGVVEKVLDSNIEGIWKPEEVDPDAPPPVRPGWNTVEVQVVSVTVTDDREIIADIRVENEPMTLKGYLSSSPREVYPGSEEVNFTVHVDERTLLSSINRAQCSLFVSDVPRAVAVFRIEVKKGDGETGFTQVRLFQAN